MYNPTKWCGQYYPGRSSYPPYYQRVPDRGNYIKSSYSDKVNSTFSCALPGPLCLAGYCENGTWKCPQLQDPAHSDLSQSLECQKVDNADGSWGWACSPHQVTLHR